MALQWPEVAAWPRFMVRCGMSHFQYWSDRRASDPVQSAQKHPCQRWTV
jgi:hypothetical protein